MADLSTKQKILDASIKLFNENGLANVRLQQIASEIGISVGNLAYHFRNKEAIIDAINENLNKEILSVLSQYRVYPNLIDFDVQLTKYFEFLQKYPFYFIDLLEVKRSYPEVGKNRTQSISKMVSQIRKRFDFNLSRGLMKPEPRPGIYDSVAESIWSLIAFSVPQSMVRGNGNKIKLEKFKAMVWNQIFPYFNERGIAEFEQLIVPLLKRKSI